MENKSFSFFRFEDLRIYHKALDYAHWVNEQLRLMHSDLLSDQYRMSFSKSAIHIAINIAEGSGRNKSQFVYYLKMARSAVRECVVFTTAGLTEGYLNQQQHDDSRNTLIEISKMVGALITSLQKGRKEDGDHDDFDDHAGHHDHPTFDEENEF